MFQYMHKSPIMTLYHQVPSSINLNWPSTTKYQLASIAINDPVPSSNNWCHLIIHHLITHIWANWILRLIWWVTHSLISLVFPILQNSAFNTWSRQLQSSLDTEIFCAVLGKGFIKIHINLESLTNTLQQTVILGCIMPFKPVPQVFSMAKEFTLSNIFWIQGETLQPKLGATILNHSQYPMDDAKNKQNTLA